MPQSRSGSLRQARHRGLQVPRASRPTQSFTHFEDKPGFDEVEVLANRYLEEYVTGKLDRLDVAYTRFDSIARQAAVVETLLPLGALDGAQADGHGAKRQSQYEFLPSAESILEEVVPPASR